MSRLGLTDRLTRRNQLCQLDLNKQIALKVDVSSDALGFAARVCSAPLFSTRPGWFFDGLLTLLGLKRKLSIPNSSNAIVK